MDIKHIEELAKDKNLNNIWFCSYLMDFAKDEWKDEKDEEELAEIKEWGELTDEEKETLIDSAIYFWTKDESGASVCDICNCVMLNQKEILDDTMDKWDFFDKLAWFTD